MKAVIIGFAACYKSSAGRLAAQKLNCDFADVDKLIENKAGASAGEILRTQGETAFRQLETQVLCELAQRDNVIVSCGGGSVLSPTFELLAENSTAVWLTASAKTIYNRLNGRTRPLFDNLSLNELEVKIKERGALYSKYAAVKISTDNRSSAQVAEEIVSLLKK